MPNHVPTEQKRQSKSLLSLIAGLVVLSILWRVYLAQIFIFWADELWTYLFVTSPKSYWSHLFFPLDDRPPFFHMLMKLLTSLTINEFWLRLPALFAGIVMQISLIKFVWKKHQIWAVIAALLSFNFYFFVMAATKARDYGLMILVAWWQISLAWFWLDSFFAGKRKPDLNLRRWWLWGVVTCLGVSLNYVYLPFYFAIVIGLVLMGIYALKIRVLTNFELVSWLKQLVLASFPAGLIAAYYLLMGGQLHYLIQTTGWLMKPDFFQISHLLLNLFNIKVVAEFGLDLTTNWINLIWLIIGFSVLGTGWKMAWSKAEWQRLIIFSGIVISINLGAIIIGSLLSKTSFFSFIFFSPLSVVSLLITSLAITQFFILPSRWLKIGAGICLVIWLIAGLWQFNQLNLVFGSLAKYGQENRFFISTLQANLKNSDQLIFTSINDDLIYRRYYFSTREFSEASMLVDEIRPSQKDYCSPQQVLAFPSGTKLIMGVSGPNSNKVPTELILDEVYPLYPANKINLDQICSGTISLVQQFSNYSIWNCDLKSKLTLSNYRYILD